MNQTKKKGVHDSQNVRLFDEIKHLLIVNYYANSAMLNKQSQRHNIGNLPISPISLAKNAGSIPLGLVLPFGQGPAQLSFLVFDDGCYTLSSSDA